MSEDVAGAYDEVAARYASLFLGDLDAASIGGVFARYSIIHLRPGQLADTFAEWARVLDAGAPVLLFFFASRHPAHHGTPFDHKVAPAFELDPATVGGILGAADFEQIRIGASPLPPGGRPLDQGVVLARRSTR